MPTLARIDQVDLLQHVIVKAVPGQLLFEDDTDRTLLLAKLGPLLRRTGTHCLAWTLAADHFHLLVRPSTQRLANLMLPLLVGYARAFNRRHGRRGRLYHGRYRSVVCDEEILFKEMVRYLHLHPLRCGEVANLKELESYPWCGHGVLLGLREQEGQSAAEVLHCFGRKTERCRLAYRRFVKAGAGQGTRWELAGGGKRRVLRLGVDPQPTLWDGRVLGSSSFVQEVAEGQTCRAPVRGRSHHIYSAVRPEVIPVPELVEKVAEAVGLSGEEVRRRSRVPEVARARSAVCYLAYIRNVHPGKVVGAELGIAPSTVCASARAGERICRTDYRLIPLLG
ncbi:transposase [Geomonas sp. Red276]